MKWWRIWQLRKQLRQRDFQLQKAAMEQLATLGSRGALRIALERWWSWGGEFPGLQALRDSGPRASGLLTKLVNDKNWRVRGAAIDVLGALGYVCAADLVARHVWDPIPGIRQRACTTLARFQDSRAVIPLLLLITEDCSHGRGRPYGYTSLHELMSSAAEKLTSEDLTWVARLCCYRYLGIQSHGTRIIETVHVERCPEVRDLALKELTRRGLRIMHPRRERIAPGSSDEALDIAEMSPTQLATALRENLCRLGIRVWPPPDPVPEVRYTSRAPDGFWKP